MSEKTSGILHGGYIDSTHGSGTLFRWVKAPTSDELIQLTPTIVRRFARFLERQGLLERDVEGAWLTSSAGGGEYVTPFAAFFANKIRSYNP